MKQTNNAIKFLMAQYRAIFKNAYFKGMASALVLTAGLAASAAQAASTEDPFYQNSGTWAESAEYVDDTASGMNRVAGDYDDGTAEGHDDGKVIGETLVVGSEGSIAPNEHEADIGKITSGSAYGGYVAVSSGELSVEASDNKLYVLSGGEISTSGGNIVGGWAKNGGSGQATASGNFVGIHNGATISNGGQILGAWASSLNGATATNNRVEIGEVVKADGSQQNPVTPITVTKGVYGAQVWADNGAVGGTYTATGNSASLTNATFSGAETVPIMAGAYLKANGLDKNAVADRMEAAGNSLSLTNVQVQP